MLRDVAVMAADGGDRVTDRDALRGQRRLFGHSETTAHRVPKSVGGCAARRLRKARADPRARAWHAGARPETITLDIDGSERLGGSGPTQAAGRMISRCRNLPNKEFRRL